MKILIVELSTSHAEIIEGSINALMPWTVDLAIHERSVSQVKNLQTRINVFKLPDRLEVATAKKIIRDNNYDLILFNSAQGKKVLSLVLKTFFITSQCAGFHHNPKKIISSFTQTLIKLKIKKYILLAQYNKDYLVRQGAHAKNLHVFYPVVEKFRANSYQNEPKLIAIPGVLKQGRRDYFGLIQIIRQNPQHFKNIKFELLGNSLTHDGPEIKKQIASLDLTDFFQLYEGYVEQTTFDQCIHNCHYVMPLIHPGIKFFEEYLHTKISGSFILAFSFHKPLLLHDLFSSIQDFKENCLFYNLKNLGIQIHKTTSLHHHFYDRFKTEAQSKQLQDFLFPNQPSFSIEGRK